MLQHETDTLLSGRRNRVYTLWGPPSRVSPQHKRLREMPPVEQRPGLELLLQLQGCLKPS